MASRLNVDETKLMATLKATVCKNMTDEQVMAYTVVANEYNLNPFIREIYAFPGKGGDVVPVVSVDGWVKIINQHPAMDGVEFEWAYDKDDKLHSCTSIIWRKDRSRPVKVTEYLSECRRNTEPWKMEHRMLRHKALKEGGRVAFGFSGIFDEDEAYFAVVESEPQKSVAAQVTSTPTTTRKPRTIEAEVQPTAPAAPSEPPADEFVLQNRLAAFVAGEGCNFDDLRTVATEMGLLEGRDADAGAFIDLSDALTKKLLGAQAGLKAMLKKVKEDGGAR